jgi:hypothetical protein
MLTEPRSHRKVSAPVGAFLAAYTWVETLDQRVACWEHLVPVAHEVIADPLLLQAEYWHLVRPDARVDISAPGWSHLVQFNDTGSLNSWSRPLAEIWHAVAGVPRVGQISMTN